MKLPIMMAIWMTAGLQADPLPRTVAETLSGQRVYTPDVFGGRPALVVVSFSRGAGERSAEWVKALEGEGLQAWTVAILESAPRLIRPLIRREMKSDTPESRRGRSLCVYEDERKWRAALSVVRDDVPVVALLDAKANVIWHEHGFYSVELMRTVREKMARTASVPPKS